MQHFATISFHFHLPWSWPPRSTALYHARWLSSLTERHHHRHDGPDFLHPHPQHIQITPQSTSETASIQVKKGPEKFQTSAGLLSEWIIFHWRKCGASPQLRAPNPAMSVQKYLPNSCTTTPAARACIDENMTALNIAMKINRRQSVDQH